MLIGWGCYMAMGRPLQSDPLPDGAHTDCIDLPDRYGCFDLFIGVAQLDWTGARRWRRDMAGMSLRRWDGGWRPPVAEQPPNTSVCI